MNEKDYFFLSAIIFTVGVVLHAVRVVGGYSLEFGNRDVPLSLSFIVVAVGIVMAYYGFKFENKAQRR